MMDHEQLLKELEEIRDGYKKDVKQFIAFMKERSLTVGTGLREYAAWLDEEHEGLRYSPSTVNRKLAAAKSRIRYAFKYSSAAESLQGRYRLEDILSEVRVKPIGNLPLPTHKVLSGEEVKKMAKETRDTTVRFMVLFLVGTGVRVSEMLGIRLEDIRHTGNGFVEIGVRGKGGKERVVHAKKSFVDHICGHFRGQRYLFEHDGKPFNRISVTNRIKHESLRTIRREVTAQQLRYTWAMIQIRRGKNVRAVASVLGYNKPMGGPKISAAEALIPEESFLDIDAIPGGDE